jgi:hypothetical protein
MIKLVLEFMLVPRLSQIDGSLYNNSIILGISFLNKQTGGHIES